MKIKRLVTFISGIACSLAFLSGCAAGFFEEEINVVFMNEGEIVDSGVITQFKNFKTPTISDAYVPTNFKFLGWTTYAMNELDRSSSANFKTQYIGPGKMIHYMEAKPHVVNSTVTYNALIMHKDDIPREYHYAVVAWYNKPGTSGINQDNIDWVSDHLTTYLTNEGVSKEDVSSVLFRGYSGNVGPSTGQIISDGDVDIMLGWADNIISTDTGAIPEDMIRETATLQVFYNDAIKNRRIHLLSDNPGALKVMEYLKSEEVANYFNPPQE